MSRTAKPTVKSATLAIVTRTKNRPMLLQRALQSIAQQTSQDYVHVILNDGGDKQQFEETLTSVPDDRRIILQNDQSVGLIAALNQAIKAADTAYISILDDDDTWHPDRTKTVLEYFKENPATKACVVKMDIVIEEVEGDTVKKIDQYLHPDSGDGEINLYKQCSRNYISNGIVTFARGVYDELGGYDEKLLTGEDWDFGLRLLMKYDVDLIDSETPLFYYHQRPTLADDNGNSVHAGVRNQEVAINRIRNKYLREDIVNGRLGVGYIMNQTEADLANVVRIEGHINRTVTPLREDIDELKHTVHVRTRSFIKKVAHKLRS